MTGPDLGEDKSKDESVCPTNPGLADFRAKARSVSLTSNTGLKPGVSQCFWLRSLDWQTRSDNQAFARNFRAEARHL